MCYEWGTSNYERRVDDESGVLSASNHFMAASWHVFREIPDGQNAGFSRERCANLLALAKKDEGKIDAHQMMDFFDLSIPKGGPSFHSESGFTTYYTIVAVPKELKIWINVRNFQGWKQVDLQPLFD